MRTFFVTLLLATLSCAAREQADPAEAVELKWPRQFEKNGDRVVVYDPQVDAWEKHERLRARSAVVVTPQGAAEPLYGVIEYEVETEVHVEYRQVLLIKRVFKSIRFQGVDIPRAARGEEIVRRVLGTLDPFYVSLDFLLEYAKEDVEKVPSIEVNLAPPPITVSQEPAILVIFMGEPKLEAVAGTELRYATNTNWDVIFHPATSRWYLLHGEGWLTAMDVMKGPWEPAAAPPEFSKLPADDNWSEARKHLPGKRIAAPRVVAVTTPSELIVIDGRPTYGPLAGTALTYVANTKSELFFHEKEGTYYFLTSGRWFRAKSLEGPWSTATASLPADFAKIQADGPKGAVRASVPGTPEAGDAVLLAAVPRKATVNRKDALLYVVYDGDPKFELVTGTKTVYYALNSPYSVFKVGETYYSCHNAVWFEAAAARGPWTVCGKVPAEIYLIPPAHPKHAVTYVVVYESTADVVVVGYTGGYVGCYVSGGVVVFGVGYAIAWHHAWWHYHYYPHWYAYGCGAYYGWSAGVYHRGGFAYGPYGGAGFSASYNPATGTYTRAAYAYGPYQTRYSRAAYNPHTDRYAAQRGGSTPYASWSRGVVGQGDNWVKGARVETDAGGRVVAGKGSEGRSGFVGQTPSGDIYAGKNGEIYRKTDDDWQHRDSGSWATTPDRAKTNDLKRDVDSRQRGRRSDVGNRARTPR